VLSAALSLTRTSAQDNMKEGNCFLYYDWGMIEIELFISFDKPMVSTLTMFVNLKRTAISNGCECQLRI
jgi:hypothetical protein